MGRKVNPMEKVLQKSISFPFRQHLFFARFPDFKPEGDEKFKTEQDAVMKSMENLLKTGEHNLISPLWGKMLRLNLKKLGIRIIKNANKSSPPLNRFCRVTPCG